MKPLAVMAAVTLLAAACASEPNDNASGELPPPTEQPASTSGEVGIDRDAEPAGSSESDSPAAGAAAALAADSGERTRSEADAPPGRSTDADGAAAGDSAAALSAGAGSGEAGSGAAAAMRAATLQRFDYCDEVLGYIGEQAERVLEQQGWVGIEGRLLEEAAAFADDAVADGAVPLQSGADYSTSNVQEAGIDEPDVLKTDGRRMVIASESRVHVVDVTGPEPTLIGTIDLDDRWVANLLLHGERVLVFAVHWDAIEPFVGSDDRDARVEPAPARGPATEIIEIDVGNSTPRITRRLDIEGDYVGARLADGVVRVITRSQPRVLVRVPEPSPDWSAREQPSAASDFVAGTTIDDWLPRYLLRDESGSTVESGRLVECDRVWVPSHFAGPDTLSVTTIDIAGAGLAGPIDTTSVVADGSTVYASADRLYVSMTRWPEWRNGPDDGDTSPLRTEIHMFDIADRQTSAYVGSASVIGTVLNQYSMSEHEGHLRVATTTAPAWQPWRTEGGPESESFVTMFAVSTEGLSEVGQVGGLGIGERIFAVRHLGDIAAIVTFRQIDPLYLLDLSDPTAPAVRGELKITGYSAYLHPLGDDLLLGVGQEATEEGFTVGTQVSLFDIADLDRPERIAQWTAPGGHSQVEFNALAFLHWQPSQLAVLPLNQYPFDDSGSEPPFLGAVALGTAGAELTERARLSHADPPVRKCRESREILVRPDGTEEPGPWERYCWFDTDWQAQVTASAVVGDRLYLASHKALESVSLESLERVSLLTWAR